jgi:hypothetical protein
MQHCQITWKDGVEALWIMSKIRACQTAPWAESTRRLQVTA